MINNKLNMFRNRLEKVWRHRKKQADRQKISCFRVYDHDLPEYPVCIELYGDKIYLAEYRRRHGMDEEEHQSWLNETIQCISEVTGIADENIFSKLRERKKGRTGQYRKIDEASDEFVIEENGLKFIVNLSDYLDTGLFLDHRITRKMVMERAKDKKMLNLFAYTGSFSVYAAAGGAKEVTTIDLSNTYIEWAKRNMNLNGFEGGNYRFEVADVIQWLHKERKERFDLIVMDPPTFSNSKKMNDILDIQRDHVKLINDCMRILEPGGELFFSTNYRKFEIDTGAINGETRNITKATTPFDFEGKLLRYAFIIK